MALEHGLQLVDTKYEFGKASDGTIMLIDEVYINCYFFMILCFKIYMCYVIILFFIFPDQVHTPDSSRYWIANSYEERFNSGLEPENVDKVITDQI